mgnify:FL=1
MHAPSSPAWSGSGDAATRVRSRRLLQLIAASMVGFGISVASDIHAADWTNLDVHVPTQAVLGVALWACLRGRLRLARRIA